MLFIRSIFRHVVVCKLLFASSCIFAVTVGTYNLPPFSMHEDGENLGMVTEAMTTLLSRSNVQDYQIIDYPLARGLAELRAGRIDIFYPYVVTVDNEIPKTYTLIGPIAKYHMALFVRKDYHKEVSILAMQNSIVSAERGGIEHSLLQPHAHHIEEATQTISCLRMVLAERVAACAIGTLPGQYVAAINNLASHLRHVETGDTANMYVVIGDSLPKEMVEKIKAAYADLKRDDYFAKQQNTYETKFQLFIKSMS
ncbi:MAG TPA: transporter substrate-binding domain-containing protein [Gammaproteobacteria bacterium]|nr:transporter substrate-binding domain-containing protein [Gammaproteobacteria bacterium]